MTLIISSKGVNSNFIFRPLSHFLSRTLSLQIRFHKLSFNCSSLLRELSQKQTIFNRPSWPIHFRIETSHSMKAANFNYREFCEQFGHGFNLFYTSMPQQIWAKPFILFQNCQEDIIANDHGLPRLSRYLEDCVIR